MGLWRFVLIGFVFFILGYVHVQATEEEASVSVETLTTFIELAKREGLALSHWHIRLRDEKDIRTLSEEEFIQQVNILTEKLTGWEKDVDAEEWKARFTYNDPLLKTTESVQLFAVRHSTVITYEIFGESEQVNGDFLAARMDELGLKNAQKQVQIQALQKSDQQTPKIDLVENWLNIIGAEQVESLNEGSFVSVSAYNPEWAEHLMTNGHKMNVQVALRDKGLGGWTTVTIGTPIITIEY